MKSLIVNLVSVVLSLVAGGATEAPSISRYHFTLTSAAEHTPNNTAQSYDITTGPVAGFFDDDLARSADWTKYADKGGALMCGLLGTDQTAGQLLRDTRDPPSAASLWSGNLEQELTTWYWHRVNPTTYSCKMNEYWSIPRAMQVLGLNGIPMVDGGDNICYRVEHWHPQKEGNGRQVPAINQWYDVGTKSYRSTQAHFEFGINSKGGAIFAFYLESAPHAASTLWYAGKKDANPIDLPQLRAISDIIWGFWNRENVDIKNVRYFFMIGISNELTNQIIASCLDKAGKELGEWPGTAFSTATDEGHALLGSPNGAAFAYFLMQHKAELGSKTITKVTVFRPENEADVDFADPSLVFHVDNVPKSSGNEVLKREVKHEGNFLRVHKL